MATDSSVVLDTSALVAFVLGEPGAEVVRPTLRRAAVSTVNLAETMDVLARKGHISERSRNLILSARIEAFDKDQALAAGDLLSQYRQSNNISLGDACCLALAITMRAEILTCDRNWATIPLPVPIRIVR